MPLISSSRRCASTAAAASNLRTRAEYNDADTSWSATVLEELRDAIKHILRERPRIRRKTADVEEQLEPPSLAGSAIGLPGGAKPLEAIPVACLAQGTESVNEVGVPDWAPAPSAPTPIQGTHRGSGGWGGGL